MTETAENSQLKSTSRMTAVHLEWEETFETSNTFTVTYLSQQDQISSFPAFQPMVINIPISKGVFYRNNNKNTDQKYILNQSFKLFPEQ